MGKPKFRSSIKALFSLRPPGPRLMTWSCAQQAKTESFREVFKSFNSVYYSSSGSASCSLCTPSEEDYSNPHTRHHLSATDESNSATSWSSSSVSACSYPTDCIIPKGVISSQRFFFSPCVTKSLTKEVQSSQDATEAGDEENSFTKYPCFKIDDAGKGTGFCEESVTLAMTSQDPYADFRLSMEEMIRAHGLTDWSRLQELLHCYLSLNDKPTHPVIALAFVDLLLNLSEEEETQVHNLDRLPPRLRLRDSDINQSK